MNDWIKTAAYINAGDGGYSEGTKEGYEAFVKARNASVQFKMNQRIKELSQQACRYTNDNCVIFTEQWYDCFNQKLTELIIEDCRNVLSAVYHNTPLELCGPLLTLDEEILKHFYESKA